MAPEWRRKPRAYPYALCGRCAGDARSRLSWLRMDSTACAGENAGTNGHATLRDEGVAVSQSRGAGVGMRRYNLDFDRDAKLDPDLERHTLSAAAHATGGAAHSTPPSTARARLAPTWRRSACRASSSASLRWLSTCTVPMRPSPIALADGATNQANTSWRLRDRRLPELRLVPAPRRTHPESRRARVSTLRPRVRNVATDP